MALTEREVRALRGRIAAAGGLVNAADLARVWGVSRARVSELQATAGFPEPIGTVGNRPAWLLEQCDQWRDSRKAA
jgi:predicted DNA-binding transcriptional regulator AlpA